jgi:hypothetical protein
MLPALTLKSTAVAMARTAMSAIARNRTAGRPAGRPAVPGGGPQIFRPRFLFIPGQPREDREHRRQARFTGLQRGLYPGEDP